MGTKAQHGDEYQRLRAFLRGLREAAGLTQRELGAQLGRPQSWVYNCETGNRRVDVTEFSVWATACGKEPKVAFAEFQDATPEGGGRAKRAAPKRAPKPKPRSPNG